MKLFFHELRAEQLLFWRSREAAIFTFALPVVFFLIFASVYGVAATCFAGLGIMLVIRRESGVLKRIRATPLPAPTYLLAVLGSTFLVFLVEALLIIGSGRLFFSVPVPHRWLSLIAVLAIG